MAISYIHQHVSVCTMSDTHIVLKQEILSMIPNQFMPGDTCDRICVCPDTCKLEPLSCSCSTSDCQFLLCNSVLSCSILNETFNMLQQQDTPYFAYTNLGSHMQFHKLRATARAVKGARAKRRSCTCFFREWIGGK